MADPRNHDEKRAALERHALTRRQLIRRTTLAGLGLTTLSGLLAACGGDDDGASAPAPPATPPSETGAPSEPAAPATPSGDAIKIGLVDDETGDFAAATTPRIHGIELAIDQLNANGGVLDRPVELIFYDGQSNVDRYVDLTQKLILDDQVHVVMAGYTASEREAARSVAVRNETIYWHNNQGEGGIADKHSFFTGPVPEQQVLPGIEYMIGEFGPNYYVLSPDYGFGRVNSIWTHAAAGLYSGQVVNEEFIPLGTSQFSDVIARIQRAEPDWLAVYMVGAAQLQFFPQAESAGLALPMFSTVNLQQGYEHKQFPPPALENMYVPTDYQEELQTPGNETFVAAFREKYPDETYINEPARCGWLAVNLMAAAWELAGTTDTDPVIEALESGITVEAPEGTVTLVPEVHHCSMEIYLAYVDADHNLTFPTEFGVLEPWWLRDNMDIDLREENPSAQYTPEDDPELAQYL